MQFDLVFEGGGAKGAVFVGALKAFEEGRHTARRIVGTSAGAITATLMAAGYSWRELDEAVKERTSEDRPRFSTFMDVARPSELAKQLEGSLTYAFLEKLDFPWVPNMAEGHIDKAIVRLLIGLRAYRQFSSFMDGGGLYAGDVFRAWLEEKLDAKDALYPKTAGERSLGQATLGRFHERTKSDLSLVASDTQGQEMLVLNHRTAPDLPVVRAVRMSMSIPFLWQEVRWDEEAWGKYRERDENEYTIVDGGVLSNFPIDYLTSKEADVAEIMGDTDPDAAPTLGLLIDESLGVDKTAQKSAGQEQDDVSLIGSLRDLELLDLKDLSIFKRLSRLIDTMTSSRDALAVEAHAEEICRLPAKGYGTTEFDMDEGRLQALIDAGESAMEEYLDGLTFNATQASRYTGCSPKALRKALEAKVLPAAGGDKQPYQIKANDLVKWMTPCLTINCISNWMDDPEDLGFVGFDELFGRFQERVEQHFADLSLARDVERVYVQFRYDCARLPGMASGSKVVRYSKKYKDVEAYLEVTRGEYQAAEEEAGKLALMKSLLLRILREIAGELEGRVDHDLPQLIDRAEAL